nr:hypothetical protein [Verrucomicrobiota bacterium]
RPEPLFAVGDIVHYAGLGDLLSAVITGDGGVTPLIATESFWTEGVGLPGSPPECVTVMRYCPAAGAAIELN